MGYTNINNNIKYHDGVYTTTQDIIYMGHVILDGFSWNGCTGWFTSDNMIMPSMIHDYLLTYKPRDFADRVFMDAMKEEGVHWIKRSIFFAVVSLNTDIKRWLK